MKMREPIKGEKVFYIMRRGQSGSKIDKAEGIVVDPILGAVQCLVELTRPNASPARVLVRKDKLEFLHG